jgi:hypothetical protein
VRPNPRNQAARARSDSPSSSVESLTPKRRRGQSPSSARHDFLQTRDLASHALHDFLQTRDPASHALHEEQQARALGPLHSSSRPSSSANPSSARPDSSTARPNNHDQASPQEPTAGQAMSKRSSSASEGTEDFIPDDGGEPQQIEHATDLGGSPAQQPSRSQHAQARRAAELRRRWARALSMSPPDDPSEALLDSPGPSPQYTSSFQHAEGALD